jgi:hypothetical protein
MKNKRRFYPMALALIFTLSTSAHSAVLPDEQIQITTESNAGRIPGDPLVKVIITDSQSTYFKPATFYSPALIGTKSPRLVKYSMSRILTQNCASHLEIRSVRLFHHKLSKQSTHTAASKIHSFA